MKDPIVEEIRKIREAYAKKFNYDIEAIAKDLRKKERAGGRKVVSFPPKRLEKSERDRAKAKKAM